MNAAAWQKASGHTFAVHSRTLACFDGATSSLAQIWNFSRINVCFFFDIFIFKSFVSANSLKNNNNSSCVLGWDTFVVKHNAEHHLPFLGVREVRTVDFVRLSQF